MQLLEARMFIPSFLGFAVASCLSMWAGTGFESIWIKVVFLFFAGAPGLTELAFIWIIFGLIFQFPPHEIGQALSRSWLLIAIGAVVGFIVSRGKIIRRAKPRT
jgi:hypothetical protein